MTASHPAAQRFVALRTFKRDGTGVDAPVWVAPQGDRLVVITLENTWKVKRLRRDPRVELRPCDARGRIPDDAPVWRGTGVVSADPDHVLAVKRAIGTKYGWWYHVFTEVERRMITPFRGDKSRRAGITITLED